MLRGQGSFRSLIERSVEGPFTTMSDDITPEENERRFKYCLEWIHNLTRKELVELMGEEWIEDYRRQFP